MVAATGNIGLGSGGDDGEFTQVAAEVTTAVERWCGLFRREVGEEQTCEGGVAW